MGAYFIPSIGSRKDFSKPASLQLSGFFHSLDLPSRVLVTIHRAHSNSEKESLEEFLQVRWTSVEFFLFLKSLLSMLINLEDLCPKLLNPCDFVPHAGRRNCP